VPEEGFLVFLKALAIASSIIAATLMAGYLVLFPPLPLTPKIARDLPKGLRDASAEFEKRITKAFPSPIDVEAVSYTHLTLPTICSVEVSADALP